jgi:FMN phosphatase YigB (HAD superfamily)
MKYKAVLFDWQGTIRGHKYKDRPGQVPGFLHVLVRDLFDSGYRLGVISNSHRYGDARWLRRKLGELDWIQYFEVVIGSGAALGEQPWAESSRGCHKPNRLIFDRAVNFLGLDHASCVYVGDSFTNDILPPLEYGMKALLVDVDQEDYSVRLWNLLDDHPNHKRRNVITTYAKMSERHGAQVTIQCYLRDLTEPLENGTRILLGSHEGIVRGFSPQHTMDDILDVGDRGYRLIEIVVENVK